MGSAAVSSQIIEQVQKHLRDIERENGIRVLYACESGSRAWGFPSPDSDFDVRFIYAHHRDWYLSLNEERDVIEKNLEGDLDTGGWDLRKALRLMAKSNAIPWEWFQSPVVYSEEKGFREPLLKIAAPFYSMKAGAYHYLSLCKRVHDETKENGKLIKAKKYFYILRPLLAALWICDRQTIPPMKFQNLCETNRLDSDHQKEIAQLLELKQRSNEKTEIPRSQKLDSFIESSLEACTAKVASVRVANPEPASLDEFFRSLLK
jgi:predicted nucleotidyltransferase